MIAHSASWVAFFPPEPATLGHTLVVPTSHVEDIWALNASEAAVLATGVLTVAHLIRKVLEPEGLNIVQSNGRVATQTVDHLHIHVVPRRTGDAMGTIWPAAPPAISAEDRMWALSSMRAAVGEEYL